MKEPFSTRIDPDLRKDLDNARNARGGLKLEEAVDAALRQWIGAPAPAPDQKRTIDEVSAADKEIVAELIHILTNPTLPANKHAAKYLRLILTERIQRRKNASPE